MQTALLLEVEAQVVPSSILLLEAKLGGDAAQHPVLHDTYPVAQHICLFHGMGGDDDTLGPFCLASRLLLLNDDIPELALVLRI